MLVFCGLPSDGQISSDGTGFFGIVDALSVRRDRFQMDDKSDLVFEKTDLLEIASRAFAAGSKQATIKPTPNSMYVQKTP